MKTAACHYSNFGVFGQSLPRCMNGYVTFHNSPRYAEASTHQLIEWEKSRLRLVRVAAKVEIASRQLQDWRNR